MKSIYLVLFSFSNIIAYKNNGKCPATPKGIIIIIVNTKNVLKSNFLVEIVSI